jgi:lauroyl/myristoyl acyltransferase
MVRSKKIRFFLETQLIQLGMCVFPNLSRTIILELAYWIGSIAYVLDRRGRNTALENLRVCSHYFPHHTMHELNTREQTVRLAYQTFALTFFDLFWSAKLTPQNWHCYATISHAAMQAEAEARKTGALWVTPHFGSFEISSLLWGFRNIQLTIVAENFKNDQLTELFKSMREHSGHQVISQEGAMIRLIKKLKRKGHAAILTDLTIPPAQAATNITCFGLQTCVTTIHSELAIRLNLAIIAGVCIPTEDGYFNIQIFPAIRPLPNETTQALTQRVWDQFQPIIQKYPHLWLWMYKHWRYLPENQPNPSYPNYANISPPFAKICSTSVSSS